LTALVACGEQKPPPGPAADAAKAHAEAEAAAKAKAEAEAKAKAEAEAQAKRKAGLEVEKLDAASRETGAPVNGWRVPPMILGNFPAEYGVRAVVALIGLGANEPKDAVYPSAFVDGRSQAAFRREQVRAALREGRDAAGQCILVGEHLQPAVLLRGEPHQPLRGVELDAVQ
jgi:hypothetical protein